MNSLQSLIERDAAIARENRVFGLVTGIVSDVDDEGNFFVRYLDTGGDQQSAPARVMMPMAGGRRGTYFMPEIGDEVIVAFESGDTSLPIILGAVWNEDALPPDQAQPSEDNHIRTIVSRSGHEVTFDDTPGSEKVIVKSKGGHELVLDDTPPGRVKLRSNGGSAVEMSDAAGTLDLSANTSIKIESPLVSIDADLFLINGVPFTLHVHQLGSAATGTVVSP